MLDGHSAVLWSNNIYIWGGKVQKDPGDTGVATYQPTQYNSRMYLLSPIECLSRPSASLQIVELQNPSGDLDPAKDIGGIGDTGPAAVAIPRGRAYHCSSLYGKLMLVTGGLYDETEENVTADRGSGPSSGTSSATDGSRIPVFDFERRIWFSKAAFGDVPCARCHHVAAVYGDTLMIHGGYPVLQGEAKNRQLTTDEMTSMQHALFDVCELNIATMRWRRITHAQSPSLWGHTAVVFAKNVIVFGGVDVVENCESSAVAVWHTERRQWRWADFENFELRCALHTSSVEGSRMFVFGGVSFKTHAKLRSLHEFNMEYGSWRELRPKGSLPMGRIGHTATMYNQCMLVLGGSAEDTNSSSLSAGRPEPVVHIYNTVSNEWRTCALGMSTAAPSSLPREVLEATTKDAKSWSAKYMDPRATSAGQEEWDETSHKVRDTIARAKQIQSLADTAMSIVAKTGTGSDAAKDMPSATTAAVGRGASPEVSGMGLQGLGATSSEESRRVIDYLQRENAKLRSQLEESRQQPLGPAIDPTAQALNPYEVPVFDSLSQQRDRGAVSASAAPPVSSTLRSSNTLGEFMPRLNLNAAEPPRGATGPTGHMSRSTISSLVHSSIHKEGIRGGSIAHAAAAQPTMLRTPGGVLDPLVMLTQTQGDIPRSAISASLPAWHPSQYAPPQNYEQLLARSAAPAGASAQPQAAPLPQTLQPLMSIIAGGLQLPTASMPTTMLSPGTAAPRREPAAQARAPVTPQPTAFRSSSVTSSGGRFKSPSLRQLVSGQASMLSISHVGPQDA